MDTVKVIFESIYDIIATQYPWVGLRKIDSTDSGVEWVLSGIRSMHAHSTRQVLQKVGSGSAGMYYVVIIASNDNSMSIVFSNDGIFMISGDLPTASIGFEDPHMLGLICSKIYDYLGIRPVDSTFTVGL